VTTKIIIIGGGFGGIEAAFSLKSLVGASADVTVIDRGTYHSFLPSIHEIISGKTTARRLQIPLATLLAPAGIGFLNEEALSIDTGRRSVETSSRTLPYDYLIVATGAQNTFYGVPGAEAHACRFRSPEDAERIRSALDALLEDPGRTVRIVLAGGGTEGVEVAGEIVDAIAAHARDDDLAEGRITLSVIEGQDRLLPGFPQKAGEIAHETLTRLGVRIMTGARIAEARADMVRLDAGRELRTDLLIWTGGIEPSPLLRSIALPKDRSGWLVVTEQLHSPIDPRVYGAGDAVAIQGPGGIVPLQRLAYHARDQAMTVGLNVYRHLNDQDLRKYIARQKPQLISIGGETGISVADGQVRSGSWVVDIKKAVERRHLMAYLSRPLVTGIFSRIPGRGILQGLRLRSPL
jgi:NADH dehydrogenase